MAKKNKKRMIKRCIISNKSLTNGKEFVIVDYAIDYVKMQGYEVVVPKNHLKKAMNVVNFFLLILLSAYIVSSQTFPTNNELVILPSNNISAGVNSVIGDNCILVNPTTGDVEIVFNTSCASGSVGVDSLMSSDGSLIYSSSTGNIDSSINGTFLNDSIEALIPEVNLTNVAFTNETNNFTQNQIITGNLSVNNVFADNICYANGTSCSINQTDLDNYVLKAGDTMTGDLTFLGGSSPYIESLNPANRIIGGNFSTGNTFRLSASDNNADYLIFFDTFTAGFGATQFNVLMENTGSNLINGFGARLFNLANGTTAQEAVTLSQLQSVNNSLDERYLSLSGNNANQNIDIGSFNLTSFMFKGLFNWTTNSQYLDFDGATLSFNESLLNETIDDKIVPMKEVFQGETRASSWNGVTTYTTRAGALMDSSAVGDLKTCDGSITDIIGVVSVTGLSAGSNATLTWQTRINNVVQLITFTNYSSNGAYYNNNSVPIGTFNYSAGDIVQLSISGNSTDAIFPAHTASARITYKDVCDQ